MKSEIFQRKREDFCSLRSLILNIIYYWNEFLTQCSDPLASVTSAVRHGNLLNASTRDVEYKWNCFVAAQCTHMDSEFWQTKDGRKCLLLSVHSFPTPLHSHTWINNKWFCRHEILNSVHVPRSNTPGGQFPLAMAFSIAHTQKCPSNYLLSAIFNFDDKSILRVHWTVGLRTRTQFPILIKWKALTAYRMFAKLLELLMFAHKILVLLSTAASRSVYISCSLAQKKALKQ